MLLQYTSSYTDMYSILVMLTSVYASICTGTIQPLVSSIRWLALLHFLHLSHWLPYKNMTFSISVVQSIFAPVNVCHDLLEWNGIAMIWLSSILLWDKPAGTVLRLSADHSWIWHKPLSDVKRVACKALHSCVLIVINLSCT